MDADLDGTIPGKEQEAGGGGVLAVEVVEVEVKVVGEVAVMVVVWKRWVDADRVVEVGLGRPHLHAKSEALCDLARVGAANVPGGGKVEHVSGGLHP